MSNELLPIFYLQKIVSNQPFNSKAYTVAEYADRAIVHLNRPEAIYTENFISNIADLFRRKGTVEINCGRKNPGAEFVAEELCSENIKTRVYTQDHEKPESNDAFDFTVSMKPSSGFFDSPELENVTVVIKKINNPNLKNKLEAPRNDSDKYNGLYISNIPNLNNPNEINSGGLVTNVSFQSTFDPNELDLLIKSLVTDKQEYDAAIGELFQEYIGPNNTPLSFDTISSNSIVISREEILLEGYAWTDEFEKALSLIDKGKYVILKRNDPIGIEDPISIELRRGQNKEEILIDFTSLDEIQCDEILSPLFDYLLGENRSVAIDYGFIELDSLNETINESRIFTAIPSDTTYDIETREISEGITHSILILKKNSN